jgi:hypothetical protein
MKSRSNWPICLQIGQLVEIRRFVGTVSTNSRIRRIGEFGLTALILTGKELY